MERLFLKRSDIVNLLISFIAIFVSIVAVIISIQPPKSNSLEISPPIIIGMIIDIVISFIGIIVIPSLYVYYRKMKKNHELISKIEKIIIMNQNFINERTDKKKTEIIDQFHLVFKKPNKKNILELERLLSNPES